MKRFFSTALLILALATPVLAQPAAEFVNNGTITSPLVIDATNFINNGLFDIAFNSFSQNNVGFLLLETSLQPFDFSDVVNYTNSGFMAADTGFIFDDAPSTGGSRHASGSFGNGNLAQISAGSFTNIFTDEVVFFVGPNGLSTTGTPTLTVSATNIVNTGLLDVGVNGFIGLGGQNLELAGGTVHVEGLDDLESVNSGTNIIITGTSLLGTSLDFGVFDEYWGIGSETNQLTATDLGAPPNGFLGFYSSPDTKVTFFPGQQGFADVVPPEAEAFEYTNQVNPSNFTFQVVIVNTNIVTNGISVSVGFEPGNHGFHIPVIQWAAAVTNGQTPGTNALYLLDAFGSDTNLALATNGVSLTGLPFLVPTNYTITRFFPDFSFLPTANATYDGTVFTGLFPITNQYSALGVTIAPVTATPDPSSSVSSITNIPGRIQINASNNLDLTLATITGPNYLNLTATNNFVGSAGAQLIYPYADINLGTTNGTLIVSNLVAPYVARFDGTIDCYSARWTNITAAGITNEYHVLIVDAELQPFSPVQLNTLTLRSTNIYISDILNVASNLLLNAQQVTIVSNACGAANSVGEINILNDNIVWSSSFPVLQNLTNWGLISLSNTVYFEGIRQNPYYPSNFTQPYLALVNHGEINCSGVTIWADYFENTGGGVGIITNCDGSTTNATNLAFILSSFGPFNLQCNNAIMTNGAVEVGFIGGINITSGALIISNQTLLANGALTLTVTNLLTDMATNSVSSNLWQIADGMNLPILPAGGDLRGTTILSTAPGNAKVYNVWAGQDRGNNITGYQNNAALGQLILDGGNVNSVYYFSGPGAKNAIYIDQIVFENGATNNVDRIINGQKQPVFTAIDVASNMTVYFADATFTNGIDISEELNGNPTTSGGQIIWVPSYAGLFSSTNVTYPSGITYTLNRALVESTDIDSSGTGTNNAFNPAPVFESEDVKLSMYITNTPAKTAIISWQTLANATNYLFSSTSLLSTNWTTNTIFSTNVNERVFYTNNAPGNSPQYYRVRVDPTQP
jgi:hypothetical protein